MAENKSRFNFDNWHPVNRTHSFTLHNWRNGVTLNFENQDVKRLLHELSIKTDNDLGEGDEKQERIWDLLQQLGVIGETYEKTDGKITDYGGPLLKKVAIHITPVCNLKCTHCYVEAQEHTIADQLPLHTIQQTIKDIRNCGACSITITGGEPFIRNDLGDIVNTIIDEHLLLDNLFTNGTLISSNVELVRHIAKNFDTIFFVSIDGIGNSHDEFRNSVGAFNKTLQGIEILQSEGLKVAFNISLTQASISQLNEIFDLALERNIYRFRVLRNFPVGNWAKVMSKWDVTTAQEINSYLQLLNRWKALGKPCQLELGHVFRYLPHARLETYSEKETKVCGYFDQNAVIWPDGNVSPCPIYPDSSVGNIKDTSFKTLWESKKMRHWKSITVSDINNSVCTACESLKECGGGCRAKSIFAGNGFFGHDPVMCELFQMPELKLIQEFEQ